MMADMADKAGSKRCPVDFDHESASHAERWAEEFAHMRKQCPVAWSSKYGGFWVATRHQDIISIGQNSEIFSSAKSFDADTGDVIGGISIPPVPVPRGLPAESDRPEWDLIRGYLNSKFGPKAAEMRRPQIKQFTHALLDKVIEAGAMDLVNDFTGPLPAMTTMELMGLPLQEWRRFADPLHEMMYTAPDSPDHPRVLRNLEWLFQRCAEEFHKQRKEPLRDGLISYFGHEKIDGRFLTEEEAISMCLNIIVGGVDTTTSLATHALLYLHDHPADKQRLMSDRTLIPKAREEFLRFFTPIHGFGRYILGDAELGDAELNKGERIYVALAAANRDPAVFPNPDKIDIARSPNRHIAFGAGIHRCLGSFYARVMFEEMLTAIFDRIPAYSLDANKARKYPSVGIINGWIDMPMTFPPGPKICKDMA